MTISIMRDLNSTAITYFSGAFLLSAAFCIALIETAAWPILAELPLAVSIFIQLMAVAKEFYSYLERDQVKNESLQEVYSRLKGGVFDSPNNDQAPVAEN